MTHTHTRPEQADMVECERRRVDGNSTSVFNALSGELLLPRRSWRLERGLRRAARRIIGTMQAHLRSCIGLKTIQQHCPCFRDPQHRHRRHHGE